MYVMYICINIRKVPTNGTEKGFWAQEQNIALEK